MVPIGASSAAPAMAAQRTLQTPRLAKVGRIIHRSYTSDYIDYVGHKLEAEVKGEPVEDYLDYLERIEKQERTE